MTRILHVSPTDGGGGAVLGAYNLHKALREVGEDSLMLVLRKYTSDPSVITRSGKSSSLLENIRDPLDRLPLRFYDWEPHNWWSVGWLPFDIKAAIDDLRPDIVQFHWAGRGAVPIKAVARLSHYPIVWTLRDMWPLTGGCHYSADCEKFLEGCGACPQLGSNSRFDISRWQWRQKHHSWKNTRITYVALCNWMADYARRSPLTFGNEVVVIPNGIDVGRFRPADKTAARAAWGLPADRKLILFGAMHGANDPRKGFSYLAEALQRMAAQGWADRAMAVVFGSGGGSDDAEFGLPVRYVGRVDDQSRLALLYAAADVMVVPSVYENAAKTALEALACGTPVAAFANTGQIDIVDHQLNGYLAENLSAEDLARGIAWCLDRASPETGLSRQAREKALRRFDIQQIARQYVKLYDRLLGPRTMAVGEPGVPGDLREGANDFVHEARMRQRDRSL